MYKKTVLNAIRLKELIAAGKTETEILEELGISEQTLHSLCKISGCQDWLAQPLKIRDPGRYARFIETCRQAAIKQTNELRVSEEDFAERIRRKSSGRWEYVDGYSGVDSTVNCRCTKCGAVRSFSGKTIRGKNGMSRPCQNCAEQENERRKVWEVIKNAKKTTGVQVKMKECLCCGRLFVPEQNRKYCSKKCADSMHDRNHEHRLDGKIVDKDISLEKLYDRDLGVCSLCGCKCDWDDYEDRGTYWVVGKTYPTIDHVIPLAKGGKHSWNNVKLACHECNTKYGAKLKDERPLIG